MERFYFLMEDIEKNLDAEIEKLVWRAADSLSSRRRVLMSSQKDSEKGGARLMSGTRGP